VIFPEIFSVHFNLNVSRNTQHSRDIVSISSKEGVDKFIRKHTELQARQMYSKYRTWILAYAVDIVGLADGSCGFAVRRERNRVDQP